MESIKSIAAGVVQTISKISQPKTLTVSLPARPYPLEGNDIEKLESAIQKIFTIEKKPIFGIVPVRDISGEVFKHEFDEIGREDVYTPRSDEAPQQLKDALLRPAARTHIVFHLTRLATHRRDTTGREAFAVKVEDIARDLEGVSEWAVIISCKEFRNEPETWYPNTGKITEAILKNQKKIEGMFLRPENLLTKKEKKSMVKKSDYYFDPRENPIRRVLCDFLISVGEEDHFESTRFWSNYDLKRQADLRGFKSEEGKSA
jgi:hypothetical protein